ncbi:MAG: sugar kinase [Armatimonadota bacterium]|nr:sugar kinase [Armatimonadota bacterium]
MKDLPAASANYLTAGAAEAHHSERVHGMSDVVCVGIIVADVWGRPIDDQPEHGRLMLVDEMGIGIGGCAANAGIGLAKMGVDTAIMGKVGDDGFGRFLREAMQEEGIDTSGIRVSEEKGTSATMIMIDSQGERTFMHCIGANATMRPQDIDMRQVAAAEIFHFAGALVMPGFDGPPAASVMKAAQEAGTTTALDVVWDDTGRWMELLEPVLPYTDIFLPSLAEAVEITGETDPGAVAEVLMDHGVKTVGLKMGEEGCYVRTADHEIRAPAYDVEVIDGTGSGDAFVAGFLLGSLAGWELEDVAHFANAVGALCVTAPGTTTGLRDFEGTIDFLVEREGERWRELAGQVNL